eukprot:2803037-Rhodomonas_salina.1
MRAEAWWGAGRAVLGAAAALLHRARPRRLPQGTAPSSHPLSASHLRLDCLESRPCVRHTASYVRTQLHLSLNLRLVLLEILVRVRVLSGGERRS